MIGTKFGVVVYPGLAAYGLLTVCVTRQLNKQ